MLAMSMLDVAVIPNSLRHCAKTAAVTPGCGPLPPTDCQPVVMIARRPAELFSSA
jgi:hypothetical protein